MNLIEPPNLLSEIEPDAAYTSISDIVYAYCAERDNCLCLICGKRGDALHHVTYKSQGGKNQTNNLATLCKSHHDKVHNGDLGKSIGLILKRKIKINDKLFRSRL